MVGGVFKSIGSNDTNASFGKRPAVVKECDDCNPHLRSFYFSSVDFAISDGNRIGFWDDKWLGYYMWKSWARSCAEDLEKWPNCNQWPSLQLVGGMFVQRIVGAMDLPKPAHSSAALRFMWREIKMKVSMGKLKMCQRYVCAMIDILALSALLV
ncbi:hypothetical protein HYC85_010074 [Camellia sinensis]|uniref:Uncharacterized protein n=1 Tax=Camellia sinensis TaxID=4442 RepID=A0A7J7HGT9_CAMSI|nr:hypothetical protein HYC85_010074 [Camellia sinensis]